MLLILRREIMSHSSAVFHNVEKNFGHLRIQYDFSRRNHQINYYPCCRSLTRYEIRRVNQVGLAIFLILGAALAVIASPVIFILYKIVCYRQEAIKRENSICLYS
jgi:hypothetical protein